MRPLPAPAALLLKLLGAAALVAAVLALPGDGWSFSGAARARAGGGVAVAPDPPCLIAGVEEESVLAAAPERIARVRVYALCGRRDARELLRWRAVRYDGRLGAGRADVETLWRSADGPPPEPAAGAGP